MSKIKQWLGIVLALQLSLAAAFLWGQRPDDTGAAQQPLLGFDAAAVNKIVIQGDAQTATLARANGSWHLPTLEKLPVVEGDVERLLEKLQALQTGWPVATTKASHKRFQVAEDANQRRISLYQGDTLLAELLVGSSPGFRKVHLRRPGEDAVYTGELATHEVPATAERWLDQALLQPGKVTAIQGEGYRLEKSGDSWQFADGESRVAAGNAEALAIALTTLQVTGVAEDVPEDAKSTTLHVTGDDREWTYTFSKADDKHYVSRSDRDQVFTLAAYNYERIADVDRAALTAPETEHETESETDENPESEEGSENGEHN